MNFVTYFLGGLILFMYIKKLLFYFVLAGYLCLTITTPTVHANDMTINSLSLENKRAVRKEILDQLIVKYNDNQTLAAVYSFMVEKFEELHKKKSPRYPEVVIRESFEKARSLFDRTKPYIGNSFTRVYDPEQIEKNVKKYLWLRGFCFLILGIGEEHKVALSYFYLPGNEVLKQELLKDIVKYSFPEVPDVDENTTWRAEMALVMDRLGYKLFDVERYIPSNSLIK